MTTSLRSTSASIRFADLASVGHVLDRLRAADLREVAYARGIEPAAFDPQAHAQEMIARAAILRIAHAAPSEAFPAGEPVALIGAGPHPFQADAKVIGMLATDRWPAVAAALTRWCLVEFPQALIAIGTAVARCFVWEGHATALRWVQRLRPQPEGARITPQGHVFRAFAWHVPPLTLVSRAEMQGV